MTTIMYVSAILTVVIILTIIGVLSRYRRCKPNQVLVVYGKTGGEKKSAKLYHGGAAFVLPIIQSYDVLSMEPMQIDCKLTGALSSQNIRVDVPTTITVAISTNPEIMQNAAESNPQIAIQYKMVNQWEEIAGEQVKAFEHINLGNITVFDGGQNSTGNFLNNVVKTVAPALGVIDQLPIADTLKKLKGDDKK